MILICEECGKKYRTKGTLKKDKIRFYRISSGSLQESLDWNQKAISRMLISEEEYNHIFAELQKLPKAINSLISYTNKKLQI